MIAGVTGTVGTRAAGFGRRVFSAVAAGCELSAATTIVAASDAKQAHSTTRGEVLKLIVPGGEAHGEVRCAHN